MMMLQQQARALGDPTRHDVILRACPFESTAVSDPDTVCALHLGIAEGLAAVADNVVVDARLTGPGRAPAG